MAPASKRVPLSITSARLLVNCRHLQETTRRGQSSPDIVSLLKKDARCIYPRRQARRKVRCGRAAYLAGLTAAPALLMAHQVCESKLEGTVPDTHCWWQRGVVYQVYPRSFQDSNGDGVGDLKGIQARLDHLVDLRVDALWISPIYPSPMADFGYDVSDYKDVHPLFGDLADFDALVAAAHARRLKVILDFVPNHTSDRHPWFIESRSSRENAKRDWYVWRDGKPDGSVPNNWASEFGGPAWTWDETTSQYYYHAFLKEQPDLNWRNAAVRDAMLDVL